MTTQRHLYDTSDLLQVVDFVDSHAPLDAEIVTADWPLPPVKMWEPKPSLFARLLEWVRGLV